MIDPRPWIRHIYLSVIVFSLTWTSIAWLPWVEKNFATKYTLPEASSLRFYAVWHNCDLWWLMTVTDDWWRYDSNCDVTDHVCPLVTKKIWWLWRHCLYFTIHTYEGRYRHNRIYLGLAKGEPIGQRYWTTTFPGFFSWTLKNVLWLQQHYGTVTSCFVTIDYRHFYSLGNHVHLFSDLCDY